MSKQFSKAIQDEMVRRYEDGEPSTKIAKSMGLYTTSVTRVLKRNGVKMREVRMENHGSWKGGRIECKGDGYIGIYQPKHPRADNVGYVYEHTLVIEKHIGRLPEKGEVVHHIDIDKQNNNIKNLYLCNHKKHITCHRSIEKLIKPLMERGIVKFKDGVYKLT